MECQTYNQDPEGLRILSGEILVTSHVKFFSFSTLDAPRFLYLGPAIACMAGWAWVEDGWEITAEALVVCAFLAHALHHGINL